jgi:hypothetical protein
MGIKINRRHNPGYEKKSGQFPNDSVSIAW